MIVGFCGGTGAGKSTLVDFAATFLGVENTLIISQDNYYKHLPELSFDQRSKINFDHPEAIDFELLTTHVKALQQGRSIKRPIYSFEKHLREDGFDVCSPKKFVLVEGILVFSHLPLFKLFEYKVYIDADKDVRVKRRMERDVNFRGRTREEVYQRFQTTLHAMHEQFIAPNKEKADLIITNNNDIETSKSQLNQWLKKQVL